MGQGWKRAGAALVLALGAAASWACAICAPSAAEQTLTQRLFKSEAVALGEALSRPGEFRVTSAVRGNVAPSTLASVTLADGVAPPPAGASVLLALGGGSWRVMAQLPAARAPWVQQLIALRRPADANPQDADWGARFRFFAPDLEHPVTAVAQVAYEELSIAPYGAMRAAAGSCAALPLEQWLAQPALAERFPLYALMAGFAGKTGGEAALQQRLLADSTRASQAQTSAFMAALIETQGQRGLDWLSRHYLQDRSRSDTEVQAALLAVRVHVADGARLDRATAVEALRAYVQANPQRAGFAASDLGDWGRWDFVADFEALLDTDQPQVFASRYAMVLYLLRNPQAPARAALERLRAKGRL